MQDVVVFTRGLLAMPMPGVWACAACVGSAMHCVGVYIVQRVGAASVPSTTHAACIKPRLALGTQITANILANITVWRNE